MEECIHCKFQNFHELFVEILKLLKKIEVIVKKIHVNYKLYSKISKLLFN